MGVSEDGLDLDVPGGLVHHRVDGRDLAGGARDRDAVREHAHFRSELQRLNFLLWHGEVHVHGIHGLKRDHRRAALQILTEVHLADAERSGERSPDLLALDRGPDLPGPSLGLLRLGGEPVILRLRDHSPLQELARPLEIQPRQLALRLRGGELGPLLARVEPHQHISLVDPPARIEGDGLYDPGQVRAHGDPVNGGHRSDRVQHGGPLLLASHDRGDGLRRRLIGSALRDGRANLHELHGSDGRDEQDHDCQHEQHSSLHEGCLLMRLSADVDSEFLDQ